MSQEQQSDAASVSRQPTSPVQSRENPMFTEEEERQLLALARRAIASSLAGVGEPSIDPAELPDQAAVPQGCFVTLSVDGELRGCIGNISPRLPLHRAITTHAIQAAREDRRFEPIRPEELDRLAIEISVLSKLRTLRVRHPQDVLDQLQPNHDGVLLRVGALGATYLPQVWAQIPDPEAFLKSLSQKAGLDADGWRARDAVISVYRVTAFEDAHRE